MKDKIRIDVGVNSSSQLSDLSKHYNKIRNSDISLGVSYEKQSKIVSIFTKKWFEICCKEYVVLDFETTGLDKVYDKIIEVAAIRYINGKETKKLVTLVNPKIHIHPEITKINHITNSMVASAPDEIIVIPELIRFLGNSLIVGHNVNFDIGMLEIAAQRCGQKVCYNYIDTISVSKKMFPELTDYKLGTVAKALNVDKRNLHRAEADVYVCADIISIAVNTLNSDFDNVSKELKNRKSVKPADIKDEKSQIEEYDKKRTEAFIRDGKRRKQTKTPFVRISQHNTSCELCRPFERKVLIDDVYSGGNQSDGNYMLLSKAMELGLFHSGCRHGMATFFPDMENEFNELGLNYTTPDNKVNDYGPFTIAPVRSNTGKQKRNGQKNKLPKWCTVILTTILVIFSLFLILILFLSES